MESHVMTVPGERRDAIQTSAAAKPNDWRFGLLLLPALALVGLAVLYPLLRSFIAAFTLEEQGTGSFEWLWANPVYSEIILRTITVGMITVSACALLGYPFAYAMVISGPKIRAVLLLITLLPFWVSGVVRIFAWVILLQPGGALSTIFGVPSGILGTALGVQIGLVQVLLPFMILPLYNGMRKIDPNLVKAAESLGARPSVAWGRIFLPLSAPGLSAGATAVFVLTLGFYVLPQVLGSPQQSMLGGVIYAQASELGNPGRAGALSLLLIALALLFVGILTLIIRLLARDRRAGR